MEKLNLKVKKPDTLGIFHDSRADVATILKCINRMSQKIDEIVEHLNEN